VHCRANASGNTHAIAGGLTANAPQSAFETFHFGDGAVCRASAMEVDVPLRRESGEVHVRRLAARQSGG
jgi:hypothetical protein